MEDAKISTKFVSRFLNNIEQITPMLVDYYKKLAIEWGELVSTGRGTRYIEVPDQTLSNIAKNIDDCSKYWFFDFYRKQFTMDLKRISLCKNKFCLNCQKLIQASRLYRFTPELEKISKTYDLYHITFTNPNCSGALLTGTINKMFSAYQNITRYFRLNTKIAGIDFAQYGYVGSLRSLEITYNKKDYHPHLHCIFALKKDLDLQKTTKNKYSFSYGKHKRTFTDFEILIQKLWYLQMNDTKVNFANITDITLGYSCTADKIENNDFYEVFKYAIKVYDEKSKLMTYEQFKVLRDALHKRRCIQGYGILHNLKCDDDIDDSDLERYKAYIAKLQEVEMPEQKMEHILEVMQGVRNKDQPVTYISRKTIHKIIENEKDN